ncbi:gamma-glutamylcyclotransferase a [Anoplopoma fimbria]|uniref:gamma-glutamylcyclotransferase a n=1 Tax=Anoplopoma fimbria TaxID=229290 RepID=UPI0023EDC2C7|nr:gamma-glutamylcyclotransferase a [Anoplopoma fimbria]
MYHLCADIAVAKYHVLAVLFFLVQPTEAHEYQNMSASAQGRFMYFAYGSNLLKERLQLSNSSAEFHTIGQLKDYELNFGLFHENAESAWHGGVATITACPGTAVWGVIWTLSNEDLARLDIQEGVSEGIYSPLEVSVETDRGLIVCRTYQMNNCHASHPSPQYKQVICLGAEQNGLPVEYMKKLQAIPTNNYSGPSLLDKIKIDPK